MEVCEAINLGIYAIVCFSSLILGGVTAAMIITRNPHLFEKDKPEPKPSVADLCWPDGDHTPPEYYRKDKPDDR
jgi:hypothetical protein